MLSYQSPTPAVAGTPRYENETWSLEVFGCGWCHPSPLDSRFRENDEVGAGGIQAYLRPRNTIFVRIAHAGCCRRTQGMKTRSCDLVWRVGTADSATPHSDPSGGQAPALHFLIPPSTIGLQLGRIRRWRAGIEVDWRAHPGSESGTCFRTNDDMRFAGYRNGLCRLTFSTNCLLA